MNSIIDLPASVTRESLIELEDHLKLSEIPTFEDDDWADANEGGELVHEFAAGLYVRKAVVPAGMLFITKIHKKTHPYFMLSGKCRVLTEDGVEDMVGPRHGLTPAGTKRLIYVVEDVTWYTVHATDKLTPDEVEKEVIAKDYGELSFTSAEIKNLTKQKD
jgi:hypothetical protein|tara:strand:+ start:1865 stop:2347 length:483 start_codon:yes stop_codon:yes gene_type:complete